MSLTLSQKLHKERQSVLRFCSRARHVRLFGSGDVAILMYRYLEDEHIEVQDFIVPDADYTRDTFYGLPMHTLSDVSFSPDDGLILAVEMWMQGLVVETLKGRPDCPSLIYPQAIYGQYTDLQGELSMTLPGYTGAGEPNGYFSRFVQLNEIGLQNGTDKSERVHNYLNKYEFFLHPLKDEAFTLLELGVFDGESLRMWRDYFTSARIIGVDIDERCRQYEEERIHVMIEDLSVIEALESLKAYTPRVIIDDASHIWSHQIKSLCTLWSVLPHGGIFIVEDLETSFSAYRFSNYDDSPVSAYRFLSAIAEVVTSCEQPEPFDNGDCLTLLQPEIVALAQDVEMISFIKGSCILIKK